MSKTVLLMGDLTGRSRVALRMLTAALEGCGREVLALPTALVSNTLNLGRCASLDTTDYLLRALSVWDELGIRADMAYIGYITGLAQARALCGVADDLRARGIPVVVDPILGDEGALYRSVTREQLEGMRMLARHADLITPNITEACLLADLAYDRGAGPAALGRLAANGRCVLITSASTEAGEDAVLGLDARGERFALRFARVPGHHFGTGDLFTALLMDGMLDGHTVRRAAELACAHVTAQLLGEERRLIPEA